MDERTISPWIKASASQGVSNCVEMAEWTWVKASASANNGNCAEMTRTAEGGVLVRDSKDADGPALTFTRAEFAAWLDGAKSGEFDHLI